MTLRTDAEVTAGQFVNIYDPSGDRGKPWYINDHTIFRDAAGRWRLVGITHAEPADPFNEIHLAHASADDLHGPWRTEPFAATADPEAGETVLWAPHVVEHDERFWMFVCGGGGGPDDGMFRIQLLTSPDGVTWSRHEANPLIIDGYHARDPMVLRVDDRWIMYYTATSDPAGGHHIVAAAESSDLVHWTGRHAVFTSQKTGTWGGPTESPFVVERDGDYYLFIGPDPGYRGTRVIRSSDPLSFLAAGQVGHINAHAAEVVTDDAGQTWVTHCGWGEGGVWLAPLHWNP